MFTESIWKLKQAFETFEKATMESLKGVWKDIEKIINKIVQTPEEAGEVAEMAEKESWVPFEISQTKFKLAERPVRTTIESKGTKQGKENTKPDLMKTFLQKKENQLLMKVIPEKYIVFETDAIT
uniref:Uncharacterized protein n=1 Tax=Sphaerodactylus townsendi TaxID=933632 RepID=A0ACB8F7H1_9SAUR